MRLRIWADQRKTQLGNFFKNVSTNAASRRNQVNTAGISKAFSGGGKPRITSEAIGSLEFTEKDRKLRVRIIGEITGKSRQRWIMLLLPVVLVLAACHSKTKANAPEVRPVRTVVAAKREAGETTVLTGHVEAENEVALAFRISGRMIERPVNIGDRVRPGQVVAKLDPQNELNSLRSA